MNMKNEWWKHPTLSQFFQQPKEDDNTEGGRYGFTGRGADGIAQPERRVPGVGDGSYDAHEAEFVFDKNTTQAIGPDLLSGLQQSAATGNIDLNKLREAIGQPSKQGFQTGGITKPRNGDAVATPVGEGTIPQKPQPVPQMQKPVIGGGKGGEMQKPVIGGGLIKPLTPQNIIPQTQDINIIQPKGPGPIIPETVKPQTQPEFNVTPGNLIDVKIDQPMQPPVIGGGMGGQKKPVIPAKPVTPVPQKVTPGPEAISDISQISQGTIDKINQQNIPMDEVMNYIKGIMTGDNPYFQQIKDLLMQDIGGAGAAATAAMKAEARMRGVSEEMVGSMGLTRQRDVEAIGSKALGELAVQQSQMGMQAAKDLFGMQIQSEQLQMAKDQFDFHQETWNKEFDFMKQKYGDLEGGRIAQDIANGMTWDQIKQKYPNMTYDDYKSMKDASPLGQLNWQKQMDAINMLLSAGGEQNFKNAAEMLNKMFPGMNIDFSNAINTENAQKFSQGMGNLASYIASGLSWEDAFKAMQSDGTLDLLNMTESDVESMYNKLMLQQNPILQAEETYQQLLDQGIINQDQYDEIMSFITWGLTHPEGIEFSDGWSVFDNNGNEVGFFKTQKEMEEWVTNNPGEYQTSFVKNHIGVKGTIPTGPGQGDGGDQAPSGVGSGDVYFKDGVMYRKNQDGSIEEIMDTDYDPETTESGDLFMVGNDLYIKGDDKSTKIPKDILDDVWGDTANKIANYSSDYADTIPLQEKIFSKRIKEILSGEKDTKGLDNATFRALLGSNNAPWEMDYNRLMNPDQEVDVVDDSFNSNSKKKRRVVPMFEKLKEGNLITINKNGNPTVFKFVSKNRSVRAGYDRTIYTFVNAQTGEKMQFDCDREMGIRNYTSSYYNKED